MTRLHGLLTAVTTCLALAPAHADDRLAAMQLDIDTVLGVRAELSSAVALVAARHAELEQVVEQVRAGSHPASAEIETLREALAAEGAVRGVAEARAVERLNAEITAFDRWLAASRDDLAALGAVHAAEREVYLTAKREHDDLAAELAELVDRFNAAVAVFNAGALDGAAHQAEIARLGAMERRIVETRAERVRRRDLALERYETLEAVDREWQAARTAFEGERAMRAAALADRRAAYQAEREREAQVLQAAAREARARVAALESRIRDDIGARRAARDTALATLDEVFGTDPAALAAAIDAWLANGSRDGLYVDAQTLAGPRFDRSRSSVDALYSAIERITTPPAPRALRVIEEDG